jgi:hypothetical protein
MKTRHTMILVLAAGLVLSCGGSSYESPTGVQNPPDLSGAWSGSVAFYATDADLNDCEAAFPALGIFAPATLVLHLEQAGRAYNATANIGSRELYLLHGDVTAGGMQASLSVRVAEAPSEALARCEGDLGLTRDTSRSGGTLSYDFGGRMSGWFITYYNSTAGPIAVTARVDGLIRE